MPRDLLEDRFGESPLMAEDFQDVVEVFFGAEYDWRELLMFYSPSRDAFYWISGAGNTATWLTMDVETVEDPEGILR